jgi:flavin-dependent dehydrogenase
MSQTYDALVIGGGPAGATAAGLLAKSGYDVLLLEKERFPRYHVGESFVPGLNPVIDELGVRDRIEAAGFTRKYGVSLLWGAQRDLWSVAFGEGGPYDYTWQVKRSHFDHILLEHARDLGALVVEEAEVRHILTADGRVTGVTYQLDRGGEPMVVYARHVVDASGQAKLTGRTFDWVDVHEDLKNLAVWSYYQGGAHFTGEKAGNILVENHLDGWLWVIPLSDGTRSVGFVGPSERFATDRSPLDVLERHIATSRMVAEMLDGAVRVSTWRTAKDWSYTCERFTHPGCVMAGDAAAFIDPLFSTGVALAMKSASSAAATVSATLCEPDREGEFQQSYEAGYRAFLDSVRSFVRFFYDASKDVEMYWAKAKSLVDPIGRMTDRQDFVLMISGLNAGRPIVEPHEDAAPPGVIESSGVDITASTPRDSKPAEVSS